MVDAELFPDVNAERLIRVAGQLPGDLVRERRLDAAHLVHGCQLRLLVGRVGLELDALLLHFGFDQLVLRGDRYVLARSHRAGTGNQSGQAGQHDRARREPGAADSGDQRDVRYQAVHRTENGRPQPAAGHVAVLVVDPRARGCVGPDLIGRLDWLLPRQCHA